MRKWILICAILALAMWSGGWVKADAPAPVKTYVVSEGLLNEILGVLSKESYANVATVIAHIQAEVLKQPAPIAAPSEPAK